GDADTIEVGEPLRGRIDEDASTIDPDDEAGEVAAGIEPMAGAERSDAESRPVGRELDRFAKIGRYGTDAAAGRAHLEIFRSVPAILLHDPHVERASPWCHTDLG